MSPRPAHILIVLLGTGLLFTAVGGPPAMAGNDPPVSYSREVRPILSNNCFACHGPDAEERAAGLRLDQRAVATADLGGYPAIVPGDIEASEVWHRITSDDPDEVMPPPESNKPALSADERDILRRWIEQGADYEPHWAFQSLTTTAVPEVGNAEAIRNPIDAFVMARLEREGIEPSPQASKSTLIRRLSLDLTGLTPTPAQVRRFMDDPSPDAYDKLVDHLLESPHYGERWGRHWLDGARYADSDGYSIDNARTMWPYRDWVIRALNEDMPFDRFTVEQVAGDLLPDATPQQKLASAFHRNTLINQEGGSDPEQFRNEVAVDRVNTTGAVWLGLTMACAQCHTHKYDPITHKDYFSMFAFFNQATDRNNRGEQIELNADQLPLGHPRMDRDAEAAIPPVKVMVMRDLPPERHRDTFVHLRGDFLSPDRETGPLQPAVPAALPQIETRDRPLDRLDLARWLVDRDNPLTARVTVNRIWMRYFGLGLVETEEDFGMQGSLPTHPRLLDWLALTFIENNWSMKQVHRLIVTSATYRRSSAARPDLMETDPRNLMLARQNRLRVDAEIVRDLMLSASGDLAPSLGGPPVFPPQPAGVYSFTQRAKRWNTSTGPDRHRRTLYTHFYRSAPYPLLTTFDAPNFATTCTRRTPSNTPLQSLTMANDAGLHELNQAMGHRLLTEIDARGEQADRERIRLAFQLSFARAPREAETAHLLDWLSTARESFASQPERARSFAGPDLESGVPSAEAAAWVGLSRVVFNTDEFITRE